MSLAGLIALVGVLLLGINTGPGRQFVANQLAGYTLASGLKFDIGRLDGSLYGKLVIHDLRISDPNGVFATAQLVRLDWRPFAYLNGHVDIRSLTAPQVTVRRLPTLTPSDPNTPILPDLDIDVGRMKVDRLVLLAPVTGTRQVAAIDAKAHIADARAQVSGRARSSMGDALDVIIDAIPDQDRLVLDARLDAPSGGAIAGLAGLGAPLVARLGGKGSWKAWDGTLRVSSGGQPLAAVELRAREGIFTVKGAMRPDLVVTGPVARLTAPRVMIDAAVALQNRRADTRIALRSPALAVAANGLLDLAANRFRRFRVEAQLLKPGSIAANLNGNNVRLALALDGPFARPAVDYTLRADAIGFGSTVVEGLTARGKSQVDADRILVPVAARARRVSGLNAAAGGLLTNVAIDGDIAISGSTALSDNLRIRSDKIAATAVIVADLAGGTYRGALKGRVNDYLVDGVGIIDLTTDVKLASAASGGFGLQGHIAAQTVKITNAGARDFLGGQTIVSTDLGFGADGVTRISQLRLSAPQFRITSGEGSYRPDGAIAFRGAGYSTRYGPLTVGVTGTVQQPLVRLHADRPGLGVGLANVDATISGTGSGYAVKAAGGSSYGPFSADAFVRSAKGPLTIDVNKARFAEVDFAGRVAQTQAGPFAGRLTANGRGISGDVQLGAEGKVQRAELSATASGARIPGATPITIDRAIVKATAILYPDAPSVVGDAQLAGLRRGAFVLKTARAKIDYRGGRGTAQLVANGQSATSFDIAANAQLSPKRYRIAAQGHAGGVAFSLAQPAQVRIDGARYTLLPVTIILPQGRVDIAGRYGDGLRVQSRFDNLDLSIANAFSPGLGIGGRGTGSLNLVQPSGSAVPDADLRLDISNFTRAGVAGASEPVNIAAIGQLRGEGATLNALIRQRGVQIGRMQARLASLGGGGRWSDRLFAAPLSGGIRYNGPAEVLWSLAAITSQRVAGQIGVAADFTGRLGQPQLTGVLRANDLTYDNDTYGTHIQSIKLEGRFTNDRLELTRFDGRAGSGTVQATGSIGFAADSGFPIDLRAKLANARLARSDALGAVVSGTLAIINDRASGARIEGDLRLPQASYDVVRQGAAEIAELSGVRRRGTTIAAARAEAETAGPPGLFKLDLRVRADNQVYVRGMGLEAEWSTDLRVRGTSAQPIITGDVNLVRGTYSFAGRRFDLDDSSKITFVGGRTIDPVLAISASTSVNGITATINISGTAQKPTIAFGSSPTLPQDEILSRLLFGTSVTSLSATQALQLAAAFNSLRGSGGGLNPLGKLRSATGIDRLRILGADQSTGRGTAIAAGQYITNNIYVEIITDARGFTATQIEVSLSKALSLLSQAGGSGGTNATLRYSKDY
ncbi:MAG: hypothetical protein B7Y45_06670 [Sphingomonas sp. 28-66-16]|nr:MAG: hypothetical protein B7Y45_06670 [Sphingomonas sp. 28-66-16]